MVRLMLLLTAAAAVAAEASGDGASEALGEPWRTGARERREEHLKDVLSSLGQVREAEAKAADHEKEIGGSKLKEANRATEEATTFMAKAEKLLASEAALKEEQAGVARRLEDLDGAHSNVKLWQDCKDGDEACAAGSSRDEWEKKEHSTELASSALQRLRDLEMLKKEHSRRTKKHQHHHHHRKKTHHSKKKPHQKMGKVDERMTRPARSATEFDSRPEGHPYGDYQWKDEKPAVKWSEVKRSALKAGYDVSNCFVAAAKDPSMVTVKVLSKQKIYIQKTWKMCTCKMPWKYVKEAAVVNGVIVESSEISEMDKCSMNGSDKPWCATDSDSCGRVSYDTKAGHGPGQYDWTRWDYCRSKKTPRYGQVVVWEATHSAAEVSCLANYFLDSDRALEWRALDLLRQEAADASKDVLPPAEVASRYEQCLMRADVGGSAVYCETDMLRHLQPSVVRHALLISRADRVGVHWANRQRVVLLFAKQMQGCLEKASDVNAGIVCMSQMLSSMPSKVAQRALINAMDTSESGEAPQEVSELTAKLVECVRAASDDDAQGFCLATFLSHAPRKTLLAVKRMAERVRSIGSVGFPDYGSHGASGTSGEKHVIMGGRSVTTGWVGLEDANAQGHNKILWPQQSW